MRNVILSQRTQQELLNAHAQTNEFCTKKKKIVEKIPHYRKKYICLTSVALFSMAIFRLNHKCPE